MAEIREIGSAVVSLMDPRKVLELSYGEVSNAKTLNQSSGKAEKDGLFCQKIFGPISRGVCACGKKHPDYRKKRITCKECGVDIVDPSERKRRFGHITLLMPIVHLWYRKTIASLLAIPPKTLDRLIECNAFMVLIPSNSRLKPYSIISHDDYFCYLAQRPAD